METRVVVNDGKGRVDALEGDTPIGKLEFDLVESKMRIMHTLTFPGNEGKGVGRRLVRAAIDYAKEHRLSIDPVCSFAHDIINVWQKK